MKLVKGRGYDTYTIQEAKKEQNAEESATVGANDDPPTIKTQSQ